MRLLACIIIACALVSCSHNKERAAGEPMRYLAWLQGDVQSQYEPDRDFARKQLERYTKSPPKLEEKERYIVYLSVLSAVGRRAESYRKLITFLDKYPKEKRGQFLLATHHLKNNKRELARYFFKRLEKDKSFVWKSLLLNNLGMISLKEGNRDLALDYFEKASNAIPPSAAPLVNLGALYLESRSYKQAEKVFERAAKIDPKFEDAHLGWGIALEGQSRFEGAHKVYAAYIDDNSNGLSILFNDSIILGKKLNRKKDASRQMLRYIQRGGKETAKAQKFYKIWR